MSAVFYHDEAQRQAIDETRRKFVKMPDQVQTEVAPLEKFWIAEDYHQKYRLRRVQAAMDEFDELFPSTDEFLGSVAVTKANALVGGDLSLEALGRDLAVLGLSPDAATALRGGGR